VARSERRALASPRAGPPAKFRVPDRPASVSRRHLIERIVGSRRRVISVIAFAGAGKTTFLAEWARTDERVVAWVGLDPSDEDPTALARSIARALAEAGVADPRLADDVDDATSLLELVATLLEPQRPFLVMVDDVHHISSQAALAILDGLTDHLPAGCALVLAGRTEPNFVATRRVEAQTYEVGSTELALDEDETMQLFAGVGVELSPADADRITARTEGWAAGVYLCALVVQQDPDALTGPTPLAGSSRYVADYLLPRSFEQTSAELQEFLLIAATLDEMSAGLCDHVRGADDSQEMLYQLERENLFVVPLDDRREWYRFHSLFREFLLAEMRRRQPTEALRDAQRQAAAWCRENGLDDQAVEYLLRAGDVEPLGPALMRAMRPAFLDGRVATIHRWLETAGDDVVDSLPPLACLSGWVSALSGSAADAERWAATAAKLDHRGAADDGWASFESSRTALRALMCADGVDAMVQDAQVVFALEPSWSPWRNTVLWLLGQARELAGDRVGAMASYEDALRLDDASAQPPLLIVPVNMALLAMDDGDWTRARTCVQRATAVAAARRQARYVPLNLFHTAAARLALHDGRSDELDHHLGLAMRSRRVGTSAVPYAAVRARLTLAEAHLATDGREVATELLAEIDGVLERRPDLGTLVPAVSRVRDSLASAPRTVVSLTPAERRILPYLPTHLTFAEIGNELYVSRHTVHTHAGSIYRKLNVSSRSAAVTRAVELGLIGP
jgi:LuxR family maltose regulon positive regulatory protein